MIRIKRTLPPAAVPLSAVDVLKAIRGMVCGNREVSRFEEELRDYFQTKYCFTVSSGKAALAVILMALKEMHPERDEVLIPAFTCFSVASAIVRSGLRIRLCDLEQGTFDFDRRKLSDILFAQGREGKGTPEVLDRERLLCVVPTHLYGIPAEVDRLRELVDDPDVVIVEDAAGAMGGVSKGRKLGCQGDVGFFSLGRGKAFCAVEGGVILTNRDDIARGIREQILSLPGAGVMDMLSHVFYAIALSLLQRPSLFWLPSAVPWLRLGETIYDPCFKMRRLSPVAAGIAAGWEDKLHQLRKARAACMNRWKNAVGEGLNLLLPPGAELPDLVRLPFIVASEEWRDWILSQSRDHGLGLRPSYPQGIFGIDALREMFRFSPFPVAASYARRLITLPVHPYVTEADVKNMSEMISKMHSRSSGEA